jgi:hypothetical protein
VLFETPQLTLADLYFLLIADLPDLDYWNTEPPCDFEGLGARQLSLPILKMGGCHCRVDDFLIFIHVF